MEGEKKLCKHLCCCQSLTQNACYDTSLDRIPILEVIHDDPAKYGVLHPASRLELLMEQTLTTLEQLLRLDAVVLQSRKLRKTDEQAANDDDD